MKLREYEVIKVKSFCHSLFNLPIVYYLWAIFLLNLRTCSLTGKNQAKELGPFPQYAMFGLINLENPTKT